MSHINHRTNIIDRNKEGTVSPIMTNAVKYLTPAIHKLIKIITNSNIKIDGDCVVAVAFQQQGIHTFKDLQMFANINEYENSLSTFKANDADLGTNSGTDVFIKTGIKMYIRWLLLWTRHRENNKCNDINRNNWETWTHDEFLEFKLAFWRGDITPRNDNFQHCQLDSKNSCKIDEDNNGYHVPCMIMSDINNVPSMITNDINNTNARAIDNINHVPCVNNNIKCNILDIPCANNNIKCNIHDTCAINYDIITLSKNNHQKHEVEPVPLSHQQNVTTLSKSARTQELLIKEASNMEKLMNNAIEMEQL